MHRTKQRIKKTVIAIIGGLVLVLGIIAIPYPGPGWLIVFAGLAILASEFEWAQRLLNFAQQKYDAWHDWLKGQPLVVQAIFFLLTAAVVLLTIWLLNGYGFIDDIFGLKQGWLHSPLF